METSSGGCQVCETVTRPLLCERCVSRGLLGERWAVLHQAQQRKAVLLERLERLLASKDTLQQQQLQRTHEQQKQQDAAQRTKLARSQQTAVHGRFQELERQKAEHQKQLETATTQLERWLAGTLGPSERMHEVLRARALQLRMLLDEQSHLTRLRVRALLEVLPVSIPALRPPTSPANRNGPLLRQPSGPSAQQAPYVTIRGLRLPDALHPVVENEAEAQKLGTALGYVLLLTRVLTHYLQAPLLHCLVYQGSTSWVAPLPSVWTSPLDAQPSTLAVLYVAGSASSSPAPPSTLRAPGQAGAISTIQSSLGQARARLGSLTTGTVASASPAPSQPLAHSQSLPAGLHALARSLGALLAHAQSFAGARLPADWNPFACLAAICAQLAVDPRAERRAARGPPSSLLLGPSLLAGSPLHASALAQAFLLDGEDEDDMVDGWDMVQRPAGWGSPSGSLIGHFQPLPHVGREGASLPLLPPRPSQGDDVAHWERAMFTDATARAAAAAASAGGGGVVSQAAIERTLVAAASMLSSPLLPFRRPSQQ